MEGVQILAQDLGGRSDPGVLVGESTGGYEMVVEDIEKLTGEHGGRHLLVWAYDARRR